MNECECDAIDGWLDQVRSRLLYLQKTRKKVNNKSCLVQQEFELDAIGLTLTESLSEVIPLHPLKA